MTVSGGCTAVGLSFTCNEFCFVKFGIDETKASRSSTVKKSTGGSNRTQSVSLGMNFFSCVEMFCSDDKRNAVFVSGAIGTYAMLNFFHANEKERTRTERIVLASESVDILSTD